MKEATSQSQADDSLPPSSGSQCSYREEVSKRAVYECCFFISIEDSAL
ncbi:hypothetical protein HMPREF1869_00123 [Bacteroidales bacterium KA00251]|nr:hypothetical protein HMPREF1869_00123 [Bacteroidales bacterium KA00251]